MFISEACAKWGVSYDFIIACIRDGRIQGAIKKRDSNAAAYSPVWIIPDEHPKPLFHYRGGRRLKNVKEACSVDLRNASMESKKNFIYRNSVKMTFG